LYHAGAHVSSALLGPSLDAMLSAEAGPAAHDPSRLQLQRKCTIMFELSVSLISSCAPHILMSSLCPHVIIIMSCYLLSSPLLILIPSHPISPGEPHLSSYHVTSSPLLSCHVASAPLTPRRQVNLMRVLEFATARMPEIFGGQHGSQVRGARGALHASMMSSSIWTFSVLICDGTQVLPWWYT
jgi:hypothetical protein